MKIKINFKYSNIFKLEIILVSFIVLFTVLQQLSLISFCFALSFIVLFIYAMYRAFSKRYNVWLILLILLTSINVIINASFSTNALIGFDYFKKMLMFIAFMLLLEFSKSDDVTESTYQFTLNLPCMMAVLLVGSYLTGLNTSRFAGELTLGFSNPNFTGMWLSHFFVYLFLSMIASKRRFFFNVCYVWLLFIIAWLIFESGARSCMIGIIVFLLLCILGIFFGFDILKSPFVWGVVLLIPIIFVLLYNQLLDSSWFQKTFSFVISEGKSLGSRLDVWNPAIANFKKSPLFGSYCEISQGTGKSQLHNTHLDVLCSYGILPFVLFLIVLFNNIKKIIKNKFNYFNYCAFCGFLSIVIIGTFEAGIVAGAMGLNVLTAGLILLAKYEKK